MLLGTHTSRTLSTEKTSCAKNKVPPRLGVAFEMTKFYVCLYVELGLVDLVTVTQMWRDKTWNLGFPNPRLVPSSQTMLPLLGLCDKMITLALVVEKSFKM